MTETSSKHRRFILAAFVLLSLLTAIDIAIYILSDTYRNLLGVVDGQGFGGYLITLFPDILILVFYALFFYQYKRFNTMPKKLLIIHSLVFLVTAILLLIPWIGFFFANRRFVFWGDVILARRILHRFAHGFCFPDIQSLCVGGLE